MTPNFLHYRLAVRGIFGRNRSIKYDLVDVLKGVPIDQPRSLDSLLPLMRDALAEIRPKPGLTYKLREEPVEIEETEIDGRIHKSEMFELLSERVLLKGVVGGEERACEPTS